MIPFHFLQGIKQNIDGTNSTPVSDSRGDRRAGEWAGRQNILVVHNLQRLLPW